MKYLLLKKKKKIKKLRKRQKNEKGKPKRSYNGHTSDSALHGPYTPSEPCLYIYPLFSFFSHHTHPISSLSKQSRVLSYTHSKSKPLSSFFTLNTKTTTTMPEAPTEYDLAGQNKRILEFIEDVTANADEVQRNILGEILSCNANVEYLRRHGLNGRTDRETFKKLLPVITYEDIQPDINRIANGDTSPILTSKPVSEFLTRCSHNFKHKTLSDQLFGFGLAEKSASFFLFFW